LGVHWVETLPRSLRCEPRKALGPPLGMTLWGRSAGGNWGRWLELREARRRRGQDEETDYAGAGRCGTVPANVHKNWLRGAASCVSRGVLSVRKPGAYDSAAR